LLHIFIIAFAFDYFIIFIFQLSIQAKGKRAAGYVPNDASKKTFIRNARHRAVHSAGVAVWYFAAG